MANVTDELANWVLRINNLCNEKDAEIRRLRAECDKWQARCIAAVWLIPGHVMTGELQDAAKRAAELLAHEQDASK